MHAVVRRYTGATQLGDAMSGRTQEIEELLRGVPGFVAYYAVRSGDSLATITVCDDQAGTKESTRIAGEWVRQNLSGSGAVTPEVTEGDVFLHFAR
jgi:hypothetical protein